MKNQKKTSAYRAIENDVSSGEGLPLKLALLLGAFLILAYIRARLGFAPRTAAFMWAQRLLTGIQFRREWLEVEYSQVRPRTIGQTDFHFKENTMQRAYPTILILVIAALACGSSTSTPGAPRATSAPVDTAIPAATSAPVALGQVGERVEAGGIALTVNSISALEVIDDIFKPDEGNVFLVADVTIESVDKDPANYNPLYFKVKDADGFEYNSSFTAPDPSLKSGELSPGDKARGNVSFEVPTGATGLVLSYKAIDFSGDEAIEVELGDVPAP